MFASRSKSFVLLNACFCFLIYTCLADSRKECDKSKCTGPVKFYEDIHCKPVYDNSTTNDSCCAVRYDCSHLYARSPNKCYVNGHEYEIGQSLKDEDAYSCDIGCVCEKGFEGVTQFRCAAVDCFDEPEPGCYMKQSHGSCCPGPQVCLDKTPDIPKCIVDGKTYTDGQYFQPKNDPGKTCYCMEGYKGENIEPFCKPKIASCGTEKYYAVNIHSMCAPVYYYSQSPRTSCSVAYRCQNNNDTVITKKKTLENNNTIPEESDEMKCMFGNLRMRIGDELNQSTSYSSVCVKCVCEVPPIPTCQRLSDKECDVTVHPKFNK